MWGTKAANSPIIILHYAAAPQCGFAVRCLLVAMSIIALHLSKVNHIYFHSTFYCCCWLLMAVAITITSGEVAATQAAAAVISICKSSRSTDLHRICINWAFPFSFCPYFAFNFIFIEICLRSSLPNSCPQTPNSNSAAFCFVAVKSLR